MFLSFPAAFYREVGALEREADEGQAAFHQGEDVRWTVLVFPVAVELLRPGKMEGLIKLL